MTAKIVRMDEGGGGGGACVEDLHPQDDNCDGNITSTDATKTKRNQKQQRRRITGGGGGGGGGILKSLTRRGSLGSYLSENFDSGDANTMTDSKLVLKCQVKLTLNSLTRSRFLFLYEDVLICAKQKSSTSFHVKNRVDLQDIWLEDDDEDCETEPESSASNSVRLGWPVANVELEFPTTNERNSWVEKLRALLTSIREKEADHVIVRLVKNDEKYSVTKSLIVGKRESAKKILARCTKEFHRASDTSGFQLQALMSKNDIPMPLTGREILYRIQMKYNREHSDGCKDPAAESETDPLGDGLIFQMIHATEKKSAILKRSLATGDDNKPAKRASPLARFFRTTFKMADEGRLYRRNVNELYNDGKLCWRLMMMLSHLYLNGPSYEEVFRRPPALKVHRILQEKLDRGRDFNFDKVNACEMAALLKSFLSCLPESLLTTKLYSEWSEIPRQKSRTETISLAKTLVDRLPECNRVFLRHLICVLHRIASHCEVNGMPPKSLSICIGQCMLWLPPLKQPTAAASNELHSELHRFGIANSVTEILIESAPVIFGESCLRLFDHLLDQQSLLSTNSMKETSNVRCSLETENFRRELVRETSSSDRSGIIRSVSCLNYSTMSLTDESKGNEIELLREVNEEVALKLNSSWHLSGTTAFQRRKSAFISSQREPSLSSSLNSSQMDLFPEKTSIKDEDDDDDNREEEEEELRIKIESTEELFPTLNQTPAEKEKLLPFPDVDPPPVEFKHLDSSSCASNEDTSEATLLAATESSCSGLSEAPSVKDDQDLSNESKSNTAEPFSHSCLENTSPDSVHRKDSSPSPSDVSSKTTSVQCLDSSPVIEIIAETGTLSALASSTAAKDLDRSIEVSFNSSAQPLTGSPTTNSVKSHPQTLVMPSAKSVLATDCEDELPVIGNTKNWTLLSETSVNEAVTRHSETKISTPDEGYHSLSNNTCRGSVTGREFDLPSSRLERNFLSYTEDLSQAKPSHRAPSTSSSLQGEAPTTRSSSFVKGNSTVTPSGIVRRLTSQIVERESSVSGPPPSPLSLNKSVASTRTKFHGPFSPSFKEAPFADACPPLSSSVCAVSSDVSSTSKEHSPLRHSNHESCQNLHKGDSDKSRFVDQNLVSDSQLLLSRDEKNSQPGLGQKSRSYSVKSCDDAEKRSTSFGGCSKVSSTASRELTKLNADPANDKTKLPTESPNPHDSITDIKSTKLVEGELLQGKELAITDTYDILDKSTKPLLRNLDPKPVAPPPCAKRAPMERSHSDVNGTPASQDEEAMNTENKENLLRYQQLKRLSITRQTSTPEKLSKISGDANDIREIEDDISCSAEIKQMSVKDRDWHKELTEQYTKPAASANSSNPGPQATAVGKKSPQRSALIGPKISFTPMPLMVFQGNASRGTVTTTARKT